MARGIAKKEKKEKRHSLSVKVWSNTLGRPPGLISAQRKSQQSSQWDVDLLYQFS